MLLYHRIIILSYLILRVGCVKFLAPFFRIADYADYAEDTEGVLDHYMTLIGYKEAQSNRMFIIGEGIECLVTRTLHTFRKRMCKVLVILILTSLNDIYVQTRRRVSVIRCCRLTLA